VDGATVTWNINTKLEKTLLTVFEKQNSTHKNSIRQPDGVRPVIATHLQPIP